MRPTTTPLRDFAVLCQCIGSALKHRLAHACSLILVVTALMHLV
jgi:hypothetical protein